MSEISSGLAVVVSAICLIVLGVVVFAPSIPSTKSHFDAAYAEEVLGQRLVQKMLQSLLADQINQAIEETPIRDDCEFEEALHYGVLPSFPQSPVPQVGVFRRWFTVDGHKPCGFVAIYSYTDTGQTHLMWRHIAGYVMLNPELSDEFLGEKDLAVAEEQTGCDLTGRCLAARAAASQDLLIVVQTFASSGKEADDLCVDFLRGVAARLGTLRNEAK